MKFIFKILIAVPVICSLIIAATFVGAGIVQTFRGITGFLMGQLKTAEYPGLKLFEALELFIFSLLFIIFALGFSKLFMPKSKLSDALEGVMPDWFRKINFQQLKLILWETLLTTLIILFIGQVLKNFQNFTWEMTIIPISVVLISLSIFLIKKGEDKEH